MKRVISSLMVAVLLLALPAFAQRGGHRSSSSHSSQKSSGSKTIHVREYTRKNGTVVRAHDRRAPGTATFTYRTGHVAAGYTSHPSVRVDRHGRIKRSSAARSAFMRSHPCPSTGKTSRRCPGYVVDHVQALECGGADHPSNMQWQTIEAAKIKDRTEHGCRLR